MIRPSRDLHSIAGDMTHYTDIVHAALAPPGRYASVTSMSCESEYGRAQTVRAIHIMKAITELGGLVLIVDDEQDLVTTLEYNLEREGFTTRSALNGEQALEQAALAPAPDLVLLDLMLPDIPGTEVCRRLRGLDATKNTPVIMLTAKSEEIDRVVGFEIGADDYVTKPFSVRELLLRIRAVLRRTQVPAPAAKVEGEPELVFGDLRVDSAAHQAWLGESEIALTALEFKLLTTLVSRRGRVQTRKLLLDDVWGIQADISTRTVDTHVKRLRQKLGAAGEYIETLRGVGYRFRTNAD